MPSLNYRVAAIQASPIMFDGPATAKTVELLHEAAKGGAKLVVFPELWIPGYPFYLWMYAYGATTHFTVPYYENSLVHDGPEAALIKAACKELEMTAVVGVSERDHGSLFMAQWIIGPDGEFISRRRKVKPSLVERLCFGEGDGSDIKVHDTSLGRLGALMCWEHAQPPLKYTMAAQHEEVFTVHLGLTSGIQCRATVANGAAMTMYSVETGSYSVISTAPISQQNQDVLVGSNEALRTVMALGGGLTQVIDPEGRTVALQPAGDAETIVFADVNLGNCLAARAAMDTVGHYARHDLFQVHFDNKPRRQIWLGELGGKKVVGKERIGRKENFGDGVEAAAE